MKKSIFAIALNTTAAVMFVGPCAWAADPPPPVNFAASLFTADLAQKVLNLPVIPDRENSIADAKSAGSWVSKSSFMVNSPATFVPQATLVIRHSAAKDEAKYNFTNDKATFQGKDVTGLGAEAYRTSMPAQLHVLKGSNYILIAVGTAKVPDQSGQEKLAREILPKIKD